MAHTEFADRIKETTTTTGTGTINLGGAVSGYQTFVQGLGNGHYTYYSIFHQAANEWEVGLGLVTDNTPDTLSRDTVLSSSNAGSLVNFSAGTKDVICTMPASKSVIIDGDSNISVTANLSATLFSGSGASLTSLNATNVASGTLPNARLDQQLQDVAGLTPTSGKFIQGDGANFIISAYTIPTADGSSGQVLTTNGSGAVTFQTPTVGDITAVTAGSGLTGGGTTGDVTLNVGAGTGVTVAADTVSIGQDVATSASPTFAGGTFTANVALGDSDFINLGASSDLQIGHNHLTGTSIVKDINVGGTLNLEGDSITLTGPVTATANVSLGDNDYIRLGDSQDLLMYHNGAASVIQDNGTGRLFIAGTSNVTITNGPITENMAVFNENGSVDLYYDNVKKFETTSGGATVTGSIDVSGEINLTGLTGEKIIDFGGTQMRLRFLNSTPAFETIFQAYQNGATELHYDGSKKIETTSSGIAVTGGATFTANVALGNDDYLLLGDSATFQIRTNGTDAFIKETGTGDLRLQASNFKAENASATQPYITATDSGAVTLYHSGSSKVATTATGISVTGTVVESSSIEYKENVKPLEFNDAIYNVNAVKYDRKDGSSKDEVGVIAEELYEVLPDLVSLKDGKPDAVAYTKLTMYLLEALKKQNKEIQELKQRLN